MAADGTAFALVDTYEVAPFLGAVLSVVHDLAIGELGFLLEDLCWSCLVKDGGMVYVLLSDDTEGVLVNPSPESYRLINLNLLDLLFRVQVENLTNFKKRCESVENEIYLPEAQSSRLGWLSGQCSSLSCA